MKKDSRTLRYNSNAVKRHFCKLKKTMAIILAIGMALSVPYMARASFFTDTAGHWAGEVIEKWAEYDILSGYSDGSVRPDEPITVAQLAAVINRLMGFKATTKSSFADVPRGSWYYEPLTALKGKDILNESNNLAYPDKILTREEAVTILAKAFSVSSNLSIPSFHDAADISPEARMYVAAMQSYGYVNGSEGYFKPRESFTRAHAFTVINSIAKNYINEAKTYSKLSYGNALIASKDVTLSNTTVHGDLYIAPAVGTGHVVLENVNVKGRTIIQGGGTNSVEIKNSNLEGSIIVDNDISPVRVALDEKTSLKGAIEIFSDTVLNGNFANVKVNGNSTTVNVRGNVKTLTIQAGNVNIVVEKDGTVNIINTNSGAQNSEISGEGAVDKINVNTDNVKIKIRNVTIELAADVSGTVVGTVSVAGGATYKVDSQAANILPVNETTGEGGGNQPTDTSGETVHVGVTGLSLDLTELRLTEGRSEQIIATVFPSTASNQRLTWTSSNIDTVKVDSSGKVIAVAPGTAIITVRTVDGGYTATCIVTVVSIPQPPLNIPITGVEVSSLTLTTGAAFGYIQAKVIPTETTQSKTVKWEWNPSDVPDGTLLTALGNVIEVTSDLSSSASITVKASAVANPSIFGTGTITIIKEPVIVTDVIVSPKTTTLPATGGQVQFSFTVIGTGKPPQKVSWSLAGTGLSAGTSINANGLLTVSEVDAGKTITVMATSSTDAGKNGTATVTVSPVSKTALVSAISAANTAKTDIVESADGSDILVGKSWVTPAEMKALTDVITTAVTLNGNAGATQSAINETVSKLNAATSTFLGRIKGGTKVVVTGIGIIAPSSKSISFNSGSGSATPGQLITAKIDPTLATNKNVKWNISGAGANKY